MDPSWVYREGFRMIFLLLPQGALGAALRRSCFTAAYALRCTSGRLAALSGAQPPAEARFLPPQKSQLRGVPDLSLGDFLGDDDPI